MPTKYSFEVPIPHLQDFEDLQDFHFTLCHLYDQPEYLSFFRQQRIKGEKTIWLDNSYNEQLEATGLSKMLGVAVQVEPSKIISPDSPKWDTAKIATAYVKALKVFNRDSLTVVVRSIEMKQALLECGANHFAVSYWVRPDLTHDVLQKLKPWHMLGLISPQEIITLQPPTCDTSMPIKIALRGWTLQEWGTKGCPHIYTHELGESGKDFFNTKMTRDQIDLARMNIRRLKEVTQW